MIFVTVGMMYGFDRLIKKMDEIAGVIDEDIIMQIGESSYIPINTEYFRFALKKDINKYYEQARIIVSHSGVGSIILGLEYGKLVIVVPRLKIYGESIDDHQIEIAKELEKKGKIKVANNIEELDMLLKNIKGTDKNKKENNKSDLVINIEKYLQFLEM